MTTLITLFGLAIGVLVFLNLLHTKAKLEGEDLSIKEDDNIRNLIKDRRKSKSLNNAPQRRICPICKTLLLQQEYLLCAMQPEVRNQKRRQVHIYGCPHCFINKGVNIEQTQEVVEPLNV